MTTNTWNTALYDNQHSFVWQYGESLLETLAPQPGERILDLGCGTGHLTAKIADLGAIVQGIDVDRDMIQQAQQYYPHLAFAVADARRFETDAPCDAVFSNAALHWIKEPDAVIQCLYRALKPGGRFVAEFGGTGNIATLTQALFSSLQNKGYRNAESWNPWYFPSLAEYAMRLEQRGLEVTSAVLFDRPTPLADGEAGLANWLQMFGNGIFAHLSLEERQQVIQTVEGYLRPTCYRDNTWWLDYRRLRIVAVKAASVGSQC